MIVFQTLKIDEQADFQTPRELSILMCGSSKVLSDGTMYNPPGDNRKIVEDLQYRYLFLRLYLFV